MAMLAMMTIAP
jgi:hypothetical protein